jgi:hypothetical protein
VIAPIEQAEEQLEKDSKSDRARQGQERRLAQARLNRVEKAVLSGKLTNDDARLAREDLDLTPEPPQPPRLLLDDVTPEAIPLHLAAQHGRSGIFSDEGGIFGTLTGRYADDGAPRAQREVPV